MMQNFEKIGAEIGDLVASKNNKYGDSFNQAHKILRVLYPNGIAPEDYTDALGIIRVIDKLFRLANGDKGDESAWSDITGYGILGVAKDRALEEYKKSRNATDDSETEKEKMSEEEFVKQLKKEHERTLRERNEKK